MLRTRTLRSLALAGFGICPGTDIAAAQGGAKSGPTQKEISRELQALEDDDQKDQDPEGQDGGESIPAREFGERQRKRRDRAMEILKAGMLATAQDYCNAGFLFQHGTTEDDAMTAHVLAGVAFFEGGTSFGPFLTAAALDRYLEEHKQPQLFGTQSSDPQGKVMAGEFRRTLGNAVRSEFRLDPLPKEQGDKLDKMPGKLPDKRPNKMIEARDLPLLLKAAKSDAKALEGAGAEKAAARRLERIDKVLALIADGDLDKGEEWHAAAGVLATGVEPDHWLYAHILALVAGMKRHPEGRQLAAATLDRWLLAIGKAQRFGTQVQDGAPVEPFDRTLPESVRKAYGLAPLAEPATSAKGAKK